MSTRAVLRRIEQWEQQPNESSDLFESFRIFRDMGPGRTLARVAEQTGVPLPTIKSRSSGHRWLERVTAYDAHLDRVRTTAVAEDAASRAKSSRDAVGLLGQSVLLELTKLLDDARKASFSAMKVRDLIKATDCLVRLQRLVDGESTENVAVRSVSYENLSNEELNTLAAIADKAGAS